MPLDPSIILQAGRGVTPLLSPAEIEDQQLQREAGRYKLNALRQASDDDMTYRNVLRSGVSPDQLPNKLFSAGLGKQGQEALKFQADQKKASLEAETGALKNTNLKFEMIGQVLGGVTDQASYENGIKQLNAAGIPTPNAPPQYDPNVVKQFWQQSIAAKDRLSAETARRGQDVTMRGQDLTQGTALRGQDLSRDTAIRGQDLTDSRARENNANGRVPSGYRQTPDGALEFIPGGPADPSAAKKASPTEFQGKSAIFGSRAQEADRILSGLGTDYSPAGVNVKNALGNTPLIGGALEAGANKVLSTNSQKAEQAQRDFINAVLRLESGAAIGKDEFDSAKKQYFPQPNDDPETIAQKAANRKLQIQGLLGNAGNAPIPQAPGAAPAGGLKKKTPAGVARPTDKASFDALPSGTLFIDPNGVTRRKP